MDAATSKYLALSKTVIVLVEDNCTDTQLNNLKALIHMLTDIQSDNKAALLPSNQITLMKVHEDAVLLKSQKVMEKGFPLVYFINTKKFLGYFEIVRSNKLQENITACLVPLEEQEQKDVFDTLKSFFRGCTIVDAPNLVDALRSITLAPPPVIASMPTSQNRSPTVNNNNNNNNNNNSNSNNDDNSDLEVGFASQLIENTVWAAKWSVRSAWDYATELVANTINSTQSNGGFPEYVGPLGARPTTPKQRSPFDTNDNDNQGENSSGFIDITVLRSNWYGRHQKRIYRFYTNYFDRVDPQGSASGGEMVKATYKYSDVDRITIENGTDIAIYFKHPSLSTQWIHTVEKDANRIVSIITSRAPWSSSIPIERNLQVKMSKSSVFYSKLTLPTKIVGRPRWSKDGLLLAYEDDMGWKGIDLEKVDVTKGEWWSLDYLHYPDAYVKHTITSPIGEVDVRVLRVLSKEALAADFYENAVTSVPYADFANGLRVQQGGLVVEMIHPPGTNSMLFVARTADFSGQWKLQHQSLYIFDNKCGAPLLSPDGRYVAFTGESQNEIFIHTLDVEFSQSTNLFLQSHEMNPEEVLYDVHKQRRKISIPATIPSSMHHHSASASGSGSPLTSPSSSVSPPSTIPTATTGRSSATTATPTASPSMRKLLAS